MIQITNKAKCCGCAACFNVCSNRAIIMIDDFEGFLYPQVNTNFCTNCGLCEKACPELNPIQEISKTQYAYLVQIKDEKIRKESTSGGAFTAIAQWIIHLNGVVFGAAYTNDFTVKHRYIEKKEDLRFFRNSKYVQSIIGETYFQVKNFLNEGKWVGFSGTPCQIEGLYAYLGKEYENLILIDVVCHAVPSPKLWEKYLEIQKSKYGEDIKNIRFRDKYYGYNYSMMSVYKEDKICYHSGIESDIMLRAFFSDICDRPSCYSCSFKKRYRVSDFTIWDCFEPEKFNDSLDDNKGTSCVLVQTLKGKLLFEQLKSSIFYIQTDPDKLVEGIKEMFHSVSINSKRSQFFKDLHIMQTDQFIKKYFPHNCKIYIEKVIRILSNKLGIYKLIKNGISKSIK